MSEQTGGPGWWIASDGKWYPPESAPLPPPPGAPGSPPKPAQQTITIPQRERIEWASLLGAIALVLGSFMTWATAGPFKVAGTDGDGWLTIVLGTAAAVLSWKEKYLWAALTGGFGLIIVILKFADLADLADNEFWSVSPGMGLYVCGMGGLISAATSFACWRQRR